MIRQPPRSKRPYTLSPYPTRLRSRTILGLASGAALGLTGACMQGLTRNPSAEPGILGINAGAAFAMVIAISWCGVTGLGNYPWFAFAGAAIAAVLVHLIASLGDRKRVV